MNKMNMMNKTAALIAITSSVLLTACIFENQPTGESAVANSLRSNGTTSSSVTTPAGTHEKEKSSGTDLDRSSQVPETEIEKDSLAHEALEHDALGHDALGHDSVETSAQDSKEAPVSAPVAATGSQISHKNSGGTGVDNTAQIEKVEKVEQPQDTASVYYGVTISK